MGVAGGEVWQVGVSECVGKHLGGQTTSDHLSANHRHTRSTHLGTGSRNPCHVIPRPRIGHKQTLFSVGGTIVGAIGKFLQKSVS